MKLTANQKKIAIGSGITLVFLSGFGLYFYSKGKARTTIAKLPYDNGSNNVTTNQAYLSQLATEVFNDGSGWSLGIHDQTIYDNVNVLSDTDLTALYNTWNTVYQQKYNGTLTKFINAEDSWPGSPFRDAKTILINRLGKLNLT